jgi:nucleoside-diphosphate-sugar epimerase
VLVGRGPRGVQPRAARAARAARELLGDRHARLCARDGDGPRRAGDPAVLVAKSQARELLGWQPRFADLETMVGHALAWEQHRLANR